MRSPAWSTEPDPEVFEPSILIVLLNVKPLVTRVKRTARLSGSNDKIGAGAAVVVEVRVERVLEPVVATVVVATVGAAVELTLGWLVVVADSGFDVVVETVEVVVVEAMVDGAEPEVSMEPPEPPPSETTSWTMLPMRSTATSATTAMTTFFETEIMMISTP